MWRSTATAARGLTPGQPGVAVGIAALIALGACSAGPSGGDTAAEPRGAAAEDAGPAGVVAIGHSGITGEGATQQPSEWGRHSWATGDAPEVKSIYMRMAELYPETEGQVANTAAPSGPSAALEAQARNALDQVAAPRLVLIQTIDADIRCDGSDADHVSTFGANLSAALDVVTTDSPDSAILLMDQRGRPTMAAEHFPPGPPAEDLATDPCGFIDDQGRYIAEKAQALTAIIEGYEDEQERVCAQYPQCHDDGNVWQDFDELASGMLSADGNHLASTGQAHMAELAWPTVKDILAKRP
jgi:hypothetical protein